MQCVARGMKRRTIRATMDYPAAQSLTLPLSPYVVGGYRFRQRIRRHIILWATHLGDDIVVPADTPVQAIGGGRVVFARMLPGSRERRSWGGLVVLEHKHCLDSTLFYSVYGHMYTLAVKEDSTVEGSQSLGVVAPGLTPENGWWQLAHLHFAIFTGPWTGAVPPGYKRPEEWRTRLTWWHHPKTFIADYNSSCAEAAREK